MKGNTVMYGDLSIQKGNASEASRFTKQRTVISSPLEQTNPSSFLHGPDADSIHSSSDTKETSKTLEQLRDDLLHKGKELLRRLDSMVVGAVEWVIENKDALLDQESKNFAQGMENFGITDRRAFQNKIQDVINKANTLKTTENTLETTKKAQDLEGKLKTYELLIELVKLSHPLECALMDLEDAKGKFQTRLYKAGKQIDTLLQADPKILNSIYGLQERLEALQAKGKKMNDDIERRAESPRGQVKNLAIIDDNPEKLAEHVKIEGKSLQKKNGRISKLETEVEAYRLLIEAKNTHNAFLQRLHDMIDDVLRTPLKSNFSTLMEPIIKAAIATDAVMKMDIQIKAEKTIETSIAIYAVIMNKKSKVKQMTEDIINQRKLIEHAQSCINELIEHAQSCIKALKALKNGEAIVSLEELIKKCKNASNSDNSQQKSDGPQQMSIDLPEKLDTWLTYGAGKQLEDALDAMTHNVSQSSKLDSAEQTHIKREIKKAKIRIGTMLDIIRKHGAQIALATNCHDWIDKAINDLLQEGNENIQKLKKEIATSSQKAHSATEKTGDRDFRGVDKTNTGNTATRTTDTLPTGTDHLLKFHQPDPIPMDTTNDLSGTLEQIATDLLKKISNDPQGEQRKHIAAWLESCLKQIPGDRKENWKIFSGLLLSMVELNSPTYRDLQKVITAFIEEPSQEYPKTSSSS
jgi:hypothetical protein